VTSTGGGGISTTSSGGGGASSSTSTYIGCCSDNIEDGTEKVRTLFSLETPVLSRSRHESMVESDWTYLSMPKNTMPELESRARRGET
jgi:hypothetical protein